MQATEQTHIDINQLFENRGYDSDFLSGLFKNVTIHDFNLPGLSDFADKLNDYKYKEITVFCDFDMDGIMSGLIFYFGLKYLGFNVNLHKQPIVEYGFSSQEAHSLLDAYPNTQLVITGDVGSNSTDAVEVLLKHGVDVIVTDHHEQTIGLPKEVLVVNPYSLENLTWQGFKSVCGAGVAFCCLKTYVDNFKDFNTQVYFNNFMLFAGIGTISDCMPVLDINRTFVKSAVSISNLIFMNNPVVFKLPIFKNYFEVLKHCRETGLIYGDIDEDFFGYTFAPIFNSVKRMCEFSDVGLEHVYHVFDSTIPLTYFEELCDLNNLRKEKQAEFLETIVPVAKHIYMTDAPGGFCGLLANSILSEHPDMGSVIVLNQDTYSGSGRGLYDLRKFISDNTECFVGGHPRAFGISFTGCCSDKLPDDYLIWFDSLLEDYHNTILNLTQNEVINDKVINITNIGVDTLYDLAENLKLYKPFGVGFEKFEFEIDLDDIEFIVYLNSRKTGEQAHTKLILKSGLILLYWNTIFEPEANMVYKAYGVLQSNVYNDIPQINLIVNKIYKSDPVNSLFNALNSLPENNIDM